MIRPLRVLVVEDEWIIALAIEDLLRDVGHEVVGPVPSVGEALALLATETVDAGLLDVNLTREMSFPIADALIAAGIPFLFVTGFVATDLPERFRACPIVSKPATSQAILGFLERV